MAAIVGLGLLLLCAVVIWRLYPRWLIWRRGFQQIPVEAAGMLVYLEELCTEIGLAGTPRLLWDPRDLTCGGIAFGCGRRNYLGVSGGLFVAFARDRATARAVLLHELSHIRNADINPTYLAMAIWNAFIGVVVIPFGALGLLVAIAAGERSDFQWFLLQLPVLTLVVYLTRNAVLRDREAYADLQASRWEADIEALGRVLEGLPGPGRLGQLFARHPHPAVRRRLLAVPDGPVHTGFRDTFLTGCAAGLTGINVLTPGRC